MTTPPENDTASVDYYALFEVAPDADTATLSAAIDAFTLKWQKFVGSRKKELKRRAEDNLELASEGKRVLLDPASRAAYDEQRTRRPVPETAGNGTSETAPSAPGQETMARAMDAFRNEDYKAARFFATRAVEQDPDLARGWYTLFTSCVLLDDADGAEVAGTNAARLEPDNPEWLATVGGFLADHGHEERGVGMMIKGAELDPTPYAGLVLAEHQKLSGSPATAARTLRLLRQRHPDNRDVKDELVLALVDQGETVPDIQGATFYLITATEELLRMRGLAQEARRFGPRKREAREALHRLESNLEAAEEQTFTFRLFESDQASTFVWWATPILLVIGFLFAVNGYGIGIVALLLGAAGVWTIWARCRPARWELNSRMRYERADQLRLSEQLRSQGF
ncbi:Tfp pilus assembly protein PilF [Nocardiopsis sp. Huas11]|uniref:hypothetical protein n=1 Tax=Nocardiopsis sp. Huas11 TaxID=2183912 RepID=UPI000EB5686B|nr:hypothetical protein [Nocardiopsis sp. Huas11]RKS04469.1 Tfp pilus assembly protein PilF [Nocardiopsis sp. Huas11]